MDWLWVKHIALHNMGGLVQSVEGLQRTERLTSSELEGIVPVMSLWTWTATFLCSSLACWPTLQTFGLAILQNCMSQFLKNLSLSPFPFLLFPPLLPPPTAPSSSFFFPLMFSFLLLFSLSKKIGRQTDRHIFILSLWRSPTNTRRRDNYKMEGRKQCSQKWMVVDCNRKEPEKRVKEADLLLYAALNCFPAIFRDHSEEGNIH